MSAHEEYEPAIPRAAQWASWAAPKTVRIPYELARLVFEEAIGLDEDRGVWVCPECSGEGEMRIKVDHKPGCRLRKFYDHIRSIEARMYQQKRKLRREAMARARNAEGT